MSARARPVSRPVSTFSVVALDSTTGLLGVAVASKFLAVGALVPWARAGAGAVATQSYVNTTFGPRALEMLATGSDADGVLQTFRATDNEIHLRQIGVVDAGGRAVSFTGEGCHAWAGGVAGRDFAAQGNLLAGPHVVEEMIRALQGRADLPFPERLGLALLAGDRVGGDRRGRQSAALLVVGEGRGYGGFNDRWIDLRVDDHADPVPELLRLLELHRLYLDRPSAPPHPLSEPEITWVQRVLVGAALYDGEVTGAWDQRTEAALQSLYGIENLEERWVGGPAVDPVAWEYLKRRFADT